MRRLEWILLLIAGCGLVLIVREIGFAAVVDCFVELSWLIPLLFLFPGVAIQLLETLSWRWAWHRDRVPFRVLFFARLAGEALNATTPTAGIGGESAKAWMVGDRAKLREIVPSLIIAKTTDTLAQAVFLSVAIVCAATLPHLDGRMFRGMLILLGLEAAAIAGFVAVQVGGVLARSSVLLGRLRLLAGTTVRTGTMRVDRALLRYYRHDRLRLLLSTLSFLLAILLGVLETAVLLWALQSPVSLAEATVINAVAAAIAFVGFFVPGQVAVREGGYVAAVVALGLGPADGLSVALAKRVLDLAWSGAGMLVLAVARRRDAAAAATPHAVPRQHEPADHRPDVAGGRHGSVH